MGRLVLAGVSLAATAGIAIAGPTRQVRVESEPEGAAVYIDDVDNGAACESTPCTINAPIGKPLIVLRKNGFQPEIKELDVPKGKRPLQVKYTLSRAEGTVKVDSPKGATVRINDEAKGKAPVEVSAPSGEPLHIVVVSGGKTLFDDVVELESGQEYAVKPKSAAAAVAETATVTEDPEEEEGGGGGGSSGGGEGGSGGEVRGSTEPKEYLGKKLQLGLAFDVAVRSVTYQGVRTSETLRDLTGGSQFMTGPAVEVWPGRLLGVKKLRGLSVFGRYEFSPVAQQVTGVMMGSLTSTVSSTWTSLELSLRERLQFGSIAVEPSGGFVRDTFHFEAQPADYDAMPEAAYQAIRIGGRLAYSADSVEPYFGVETRIVTSGGTFQKRFQSASATAFRAALGVSMTFGAIAARVEGTAMRYSWDLKPLNNPGQWDADSAQDTLIAINAVVGYQL